MMLINVSLKLDVEQSVSNLINKLQMLKKHYAADPPLAVLRLLLDLI